MKRYNTYLGLTELFFALAILSLVLGFLSTFYFMVFFALFMAVTGVMQLISGLIFFINLSQKPSWFAKGMYWYWRVTGFYFFVLFLIAQVRSTEDWQYLVWLFVVPWFIAAYQYLLVRKLKRNLLARQERNTAIYRSEWEGQTGQIRLKKKFKNDFQ